MTTRAHGATCDECNMDLGIDQSVTRNTTQPMDWALRETLVDVHKGQNHKPVRLFSKGPGEISAQLV